MDTLYRASEDDELFDYYLSNLSPEEMDLSVDTEYNNNIMSIQGLKEKIPEQASQVIATINNGIYESYKGIRESQKEVEKVMGGEVPASTANKKKLVSRFIALQKIGHHLKNISRQVQIVGVQSYDMITKPFREAAKLVYRMDAQANKKTLKKLEKRYAAIKEKIDSKASAKLRKINRRNMRKGLETRKESDLPYTKTQRKKLDAKRSNIEFLKDSIIQSETMVRKLDKGTIARTDFIHSKHSEMEQSKRVLKSLIQQKQQRIREQQAKQERLRQQNSLEKSDATKSEDVLMKNTENTAQKKNLYDNLHQYTPQLDISPTKLESIPKNKLPYVMWIASRAVQNPDIVDSLNSLTILQLQNLQNTIENVPLTQEQVSELIHDSSPTKEKNEVVKPDLEQVEMKNLSDREVSAAKELKDTKDSRESTRKENSNIPENVRDFEGVRDFETTTKQEDVKAVEITKKPETAKDLENTKNLDEINMNKNVENIKNPHPVSEQKVLGVEVSSDLYSTSVTIGDENSTVISSPRIISHDNEKIYNIKDCEPTIFERTFEENMKIAESEAAMQYAIKAYELADRELGKNKQVEFEAYGDAFLAKKDSNGQLSISRYDFEAGKYSEPLSKETVLQQFQSNAKEIYLNVQAQFPEYQKSQILAKIKKQEQSMEREQA